MVVFKSINNLKFFINWLYINKTIPLVKKFKRIFSNLTQQESTESTSLTSFDSDGFTLGSDALANGNTKTFVAWAWKESATAGFDILKYEGNATNRTISHSLSAVPHWIVIKNLESTSSSAEHWLVYHKGTGNTHGVLLNEKQLMSMIMQ